MPANNTDYDTLSRFCYLKDTLLIYRPYEKCLSVERKADLIAITLRAEVSLLYGF